MVDHTICEVCSLPILEDETEHRCPGQGHSFEYGFEELDRSNLIPIQESTIIE
jgi:hypothetical protein